MDSKLKGFVYVLTIVLLLGDLIKELGLVAAEPKVPCLFFFGDSLFDNGNNNCLNTKAKVNYQPYGVDFPDGPTGRFSNGRNIADYVAKHLGFPTSPPPFAAATNQDLLRGVNYASGGSGILKESGSRQGDTISLNQQISNHEGSISRIESLLASKEAALDRLRKCIYAVNMGSNDYINNYLLPEFYNSSELYNPHEFADMLIKEYKRDIMNLYDSGARKVALFGLGQIGCTPTQRALAGKKGCVKSINENVQLFNGRLKSLVVDLNNVFWDAKFIFIDVREITTVDLVFIRKRNFITRVRSEEGLEILAPIGPFVFICIRIPIHGSEEGLSSTGKSCCKVKTTEAGRGQCLRNEAPCFFRETFSYFDGFHPTQIACNIIATGSYYGLLVRKFGFLTLIFLV